MSWTEDDALKLHKATVKWRAHERECFHCSEAMKAGIAHPNCTEGDPVYYPYRSLRQAFEAQRGKAKKIGGGARRVTVKKAKRLTTKTTKRRPTLGVSRRRLIALFNR